MRQNNKLKKALSFCSDFVHREPYLWIGGAIFLVFLGVTGISISSRHIREYAPSFDLILNMEVPADAGSVEVYLNADWNHPYHVPILPRGQSKYVFSNIPSKITSLRIDPADTKNARVRISGIWLSTSPNYRPAPSRLLHGFDVKGWSFEQLSISENQASSTTFLTTGVGNFLHHSCNIHLPRLLPSTLKVRLFLFMLLGTAWCSAIAGLLGLLLGIRTILWPLIGKAPTWKNYARSLLIKLLVLLCAILLSLGVGEIILRIASPHAHNIFSNTVSAPKALLYGWATPPNWPIYSINQNTGEIKIEKANSQGWKDVEHPFTKPPDVFRILVIGNSHTFGLPDIERIYPRRLEKILHDRHYENVEVIVMAASAWSTDQELIALENEGVLYNPDLVILQWCDNDLYSNINYEANRQALNSAKPQWARPYMYKMQNGQLTKLDYSREFVRHREKAHTLARILKRISTWIDQSAWNYHAKSFFENI